MSKPKCSSPAASPIGVETARAPSRRRMLGALIMTAGAAVGCDFPAKDGAALKDFINEFGHEYADPAAINANKSSRAVVIDVPGKIQVQHGHTCANPATGGVQVHERVPFPSGLDQGTVIFNGAVAAYTGGADHHVRVLGSGALLNVKDKAAGNTHELSWDAAGSLTDDSQNGFEWCYFHTLVFWRRGSDGLQAIVPYQSDNKLFSEFDTAPTPVHQILGALQFSSAELQSFGSPRALLPRGSAMWFNANADHELLQAGFDLGTPSFSNAAVSWASRTLLKDDDTWRTYSSAELVEVLNGPSVNMWQPQTVSHLVNYPTPHLVSEPTAFALDPENPTGSVLVPCVASPPENIVDEYLVDVPFTFAVPMLTGWEVSQACDDTNVHQIGAYLTRFSFTPNANGRSGTLRYTVVSSLNDDGGGKLGRARNKVTILGLNPASSGRFGTIGQYTSPLPTVIAP